MESTSAFNARLDRWLTSPDAQYLDAKDYTRRPSDGALMGLAAIEEALAHPTCSRDTRDRAILVRVLGPDFVETLVRVPPDPPLGCFLEALGNQEGIVGIQVLGWDPDDDDEDEDEDPQITFSDGMQIISDIADLMATYITGEGAEETYGITFSDSGLAIASDLAILEPQHMRRRWWHRWFRR